MSHFLAEFWVKMLNFPYFQRFFIKFLKKMLIFCTLGCTYVSENKIKYFYLPQVVYFVNPLLFQK